jgi:hypothetical protein
MTSSLADLPQRSRNRAKPRTPLDVSRCGSVRGAAGSSERPPWVQATPAIRKLEPIGALE